MMAAVGASAHIPVLLETMLHYADPANDELWVDATFGAGGYSRALLEATACRVIGIDRDPDVAIQAHTLTHHYGERFTFLPGAFGDMAQLLSEAGCPQVDGIVMDIGVSSMQLDQPERGFSFSHDGPLDMRMAQSGRSAQDVVNEAAEEELADIIYHLGEEKAARRVARAIVRARDEKPIERTTELADIVRKAVNQYYGNKGYGKKSRGVDPVTRTFQALRIHVNDELGELERALEAGLALLKPGGRMVVIAFHSLEDRIVKRFFARVTGNVPAVSRHVPDIRSAPSEPEWELLTRKPVAANENELHQNPRARSAKLRAIRRRRAA